ncbi:MAG: M15 family metallopeptidase [Rhizobiaceae bacterium]
MIRLRSAALFLAILLTSFDMPAFAADGLPDGFVRLRSVDPTVRQAIRYAGSWNFTGRPVPGYATAECILTKPAAEALRRVQAALKGDGLGLKVFDCYRPARAVAAFVRWARAPGGDAALKRRYHPKYHRRELLGGYIATRSGHSRGSSVDLTIVDLRHLPENEDVLRDGCGPHDGGAERDMGTGFDCFDPLSRTASSAVAETARADRRRLLDVMRAHGFRNYAGEWWHFTLRGEPFPHSYFDFEVTAAPETE